MIQLHKLLVTLTFTPAFGDPADDFQLTIGNLGVIDSVQISEGGTGYEEGNTLSVDPEDLVQPIQYSVIKKTLFEVTFTTTVPSDSGDVVRVVGYTLDTSKIYFNPDSTWIKLV